MEAVRLAKVGRADPNSALLEEAAKKHMRTKNGITCETLEDHLRLKRRKTSNSKETQADAEALFDSEGESDEESDDESEDE